MSQLDNDYTTIAQLSAKVATLEGQLSAAEEQSNEQKKQDTEYKAKKAVFNATLNAMDDDKREEAIKSIKAQDDDELNKMVAEYENDHKGEEETKKAKYATIIEQDIITSDFYKLYHQTRLMLIHAFNDKKRIEYHDAINISQTYLNRLIFLFFAQDNYLTKKRVFTEGILSKLNSGSLKEKTADISGYIQTLFSWMD